MIAKLDPKIYRKHIWFNKQGKPILIWGHLWDTSSGITFLETTIAEITGVGFVLNPYDRCIANQTKMLNYVQLYGMLAT